MEKLPTFLQNQHLYHSDLTNSDAGESVSMWLIYVLLQLVQLHATLLCPSGCTCSPKGAVICTGSIDDIPSLDARHTFHLVLNATQIKTLKERSLELLPLLLRFRISHSSLSIIHPEAFHGASQLRSVALSFNGLSALPSEVFSRLENLEQLYLDGNQLMSLTADIFEGLVNLIELDLSKNRIARLDANVFQVMTSLSYLNLEENSLTNLPQMIFHNLTQLKMLILNSNRLEKLEDGCFDHQRNLLVLKLNKNQIREIAPRIFWHMPLLLTLTLSMNQLQTLPSETFYHLENLTKFTLFSNPLIFLPEQLIGRMPRLQEFYLLNTNLTTVPENLFTNMTGLKQLMFHMNERLSSLPEDLFCCFPNLEKLSLRDNNLSYLNPDQFSQLGKLEILLLNGNTLQALPSSIFRNLPNLGKLDLSNNRLSYLPGHIFQITSPPKSIALGHNRWNCVCDIKDFAEWLSENKRIVTDWQEVVCHTPDYLQNNPLASLVSDKLWCTITTIVQSTSTSQTTVASTFLSLFTTKETMTEQSGTTSLLLQTSTTPLVTDEDFHISQDTDSVFYEKFVLDFVLDTGSDIVHNNRYKGWVYLWHVPPTGLYSGLLLALHIVLIANGVVLIVAIAYALYRLNKVVWELGTRVSVNQTIIAKRLPSFKRKL